MQFPRGAVARPDSNLGIATFVEAVERLRDRIACEVVVLKGFHRAPPAGVCSLSYARGPDNLRVARMGGVTPPH